MTEDLQALIDKGRRSLAAARRDYDAGDYDLAVSRGYYAMFHRAFGERTISDYRYDQRGTQAPARQVLDDASRFVGEVEAYLRRSAGA